jgi:hypothetical protein
MASAISVVSFNDIASMQPRAPLPQLRGQSRYQGRARINVAEKPHLAAAAVFRNLQL